MGKVCSEVLAQTPLHSYRREAFLHVPSRRLYFQVQQNVTESVKKLFVAQRFRALRIFCTGHRSLCYSIKKFESMKASLPIHYNHMENSNQHSKQGLNFSAGLFGLRVILLIPADSALVTRKIPTNI